MDAADAAGETLQGLHAISPAAMPAEYPMTIKDALLFDLDEAQAAEARGRIRIEADQRRALFVAERGRVRPSGWRRAICRGRRP